jgi:hypothetical protein
MWLPVVECTDQLSGYNWSNVESGIKHQLSQKKTLVSLFTVKQWTVMCGISYR